MKKINGRYGARLLAALWGVLMLSPGSSAEGEKSPLVISTAYYPVEVRYHDGLLPREEAQPGGAIERIGDEYIAVTGAGVFYRIVWDPATETMAARKLALAAPHPAAAFAAAADPRVNRQLFRLIDIVVRPIESGWQLFASHHHYRDDENCVSLRVSAIRLDQRLEPLDGRGDGWQRIYETTPCLALEESQRGRIFAGHESGGRMKWIAPGRLLFAVGDFERDGWHTSVALAQSDAHLYGKILLVDVDGRSATVYSKGHRNPQGLYVDDDGTIWETEHGPQGGDEINIIREGRNYGWPAVTYGTDYGRFVWPPAADKVGDHSGFEPPVYAFVPSIGTSNLVRLDESQFDAWRGNLLIAGLASRSLLRVALDDQHRVVYAEPLAIDRRIRDIAIGPEGQIWLWGETGDLVSLSIADSQSHGALLFQSCAGCHTTGVTSGGLGPSLFRIVGRKQATRTDYLYSDSFRALDGVWTEEALEEFLADPTSYAPGTTMSTVQVTDPEERRAIIAYLRDLW